MYFVYEPGWMGLFQWAIIAGFCISFLLSFGMGANDCANAWGTSVGSGVLRLWQAYMLSSIFDTLGAALLGYQVTETIRKGIFEVGIYDVYSNQNATYNTYDLVENCTEAFVDCTTYTSAEFMLGELGALTGAAAWLIMASVTKMPVSATQSVVGSSIGFSLVLKGTAGIRWIKIVDIVVSWVASPLLAGLCASVFYLIIKFAVMRRPDPFEAALKAVPVFVWFTLAVNLFSVFFEGSKYLHFDKIPWWGALLISNGIGLIVALLIRFVFGDWMRRRALRLYDEEIEKEKANSSGAGIASAANYSKEKQAISIIGISNHGVKGSKDIDKEANEVNDAYLKKKEEGNLTKFLRLIVAPVREDPRAIKVFYFLQILSATFLSFSHGANDTANSVGPLVGMWLAFKTGSASTDASDRADMQYFMLFGAASMVIGLWCLGHRVIRTIGHEITEVTAPSGFAVELGAAFTVLVASKIGIPVSTTHCAVGAVVFVGLTRSSMEGVSWSKFRSIVVAWVVTLPVSAAISALVAYLLVHFILGTV
uniref:Phosphate transporter n=1 Tax=Plectus sambesii TaxID=2011161 RepID=A0A914UU10_9BILA